MTPNPKSFRQTIGQFATGVTVIVAEAAGQTHGMTANAVSSLSLDPMLVLFCVVKRARMAELIQKATGFSINILREDQEEVSTAFARALSNKWESVGFEVWETGCPILANALASFECETTTMHDGGDHVIFVGRVLALRTGEGRPLLYYRGAYRQIVDPS